MSGLTLDIHPEVAAALRTHRPVVALESTLIAHGLPWPINHETALAAEQIVREEGAIPATIAVLEGKATIGLARERIIELARREDVLKAARRDLPFVLATGRTAATTVSATMLLAHRAGIRVFATGGIGGVHRDVETSGDISADLTELARTPVAVVCAGAKNILDLPRTLEMLETLSVLVLGYRTDTFPAFYLESSGEAVPARVETPQEIASVLAAHWSLSGAGVVIAQPVASEVALSTEEWQTALATSDHLARQSNVRGKEVTPFLLARLAELTGGRSLTANRALILENARLAARVACQLV